MKARSHNHIFVSELLHLLDKNAKQQLVERVIGKALLILQEIYFLTRINDTSETRGRNVLC